MPDQPSIGQRANVSQQPHVWPNPTKPIDQQWDDVERNWGTEADDSRTRHGIAVVHPQSINSKGRDGTGPSSHNYGD